ncbi:MAG: tRNA (adenosine(37)-N6)-threonylcarbamoyltransferase complex ATPase subunit type 1 TsaE [Planctomycetota bacterium]
MNGPAPLHLHAGDADATVALGQALGRLLAPQDLITLDGPLGAGKTTLVRGLAQGLGAAGDVSSPTFVLSQEYEIDGGPNLEAFVHIDAYRLNPDELASIGWQGRGESFRQASVVVVEWSERIASALPDDRLAIEIEHTDPGRTLQVTPMGGGVSRWSERAAGLRNALSPWAEG